MACEVMISDWNGTLIEYRNEMPVLESVAMDAFKASIPYHPLRCLSVLKARAQLQALRRQERPDDFDLVREMFRVFNQMVIAGLPLAVVTDSFEKYASSPDTQSRLDQRLLRSIKEFHDAGKTTGILSAGYRYGIEKILTVAGHRQCFDFCEADEFRHENGRIVEFGLNIYRNKPKLLLRILADRHLDSGQVAYIGDSEDDEGCLEMVGYPIVAFLAPEEFKNRCSGMYGACVPDSEGSLRDYLLRA